MDVELTGLTQSVNDISGKIDDLGKNLSPSEKSQIINGLSDSQKSLKEIAEELKASLSDEMERLVDILEKSDEGELKGFRELKDYLGKTLAGDNSEEKIEKAQKTGKLDTFVNQVDRKYLAGAIVLHSDLININKNIDNIVKALSGNSEQKTPKEQQEAKIKTPQKDKTLSTTLSDFGDSLSSIGTALERFGKNAAIILVGGVTFKAILGILSKAQPQINIVNKSSKDLGSLADSMESLAKAAKIASRSTKVFNSAKPGLDAAKKFISDLEGFNKELSKIKVPQAAVKNAENLEKIISALAKAALRVTVAIPVFVSGAIGNIAASAYALSGKLVFKAISTKTDTDLALANAENLREIIAALSESALVSTVMKALFLTGTLGNIAASIYAVSSALVVSALTLVNISKEVVESISYLPKVMIQLSKAAILSTVAGPFFLIGQLGNLLALKYIDSFKAITTAFTVKDIVNLKLTENASNLMAQTAVSLALSAFTVTVGIPAFITGTVGILAAKLYIKAFNTLSVSLEGVRHSISSMLSAIGGMTLASVALLGAIAIMSLISKFDLMKILKGLGTISLISLAFIALGSLFFIFSPTIYWVGAGSLMIAVAAGSLWLALKALEKCAEFDLENISQVVENIKEIVFKFTMMIPVLILGIVTSGLLAAFGVLLAVGCGTLLLGVLALNKLGDPQLTQGVSSGIENINSIVQTLGNSVGLFIAGTVSAGLLAVFGTALLVATTTLLVSFAELLAIGKLGDGAISGIDAINAALGEEGLGKLGGFNLLKTEGKALELAAVGATLLGASTAFLIAFAELKKIGSYSNLSTPFNNIQTVLDEVKAVNYTKGSTKAFKNAADDMTEIVKHVQKIIVPINQIASIKVDASGVDDKVTKIMGVVTAIATKISDRSGDLNKKKMIAQYAEVSGSVSDVVSFLRDITTKVDGIEAVSISDEAVTNTSKIMDKVSLIASAMYSRLNATIKSLKDGITDKDFAKSLNGIGDNKTLKNTVFKNLAADSKDLIASVGIINSTFAELSTLKIDNTFDSASIVNALTSLNEISSLGATISVKNLKNATTSLESITAFSEGIKRTLDNWRSIVLDGIDDVTKSVKASIDKILSIKFDTINSDNSKAFSFIKDSALTIKNIIKAWKGISSDNIIALQTPILSMSEVITTMNSIPTLNDNILDGSVKIAMDDIATSLSNFSKIDYSKLATATVEKAAKNVALLVNSVSQANSTNTSGIEKMVTSLSGLSDKNISKNLDKLSSVNQAIQSKWGDTVINQVTFDAVVNSLTLLSSIIKDKAMNVRVINELAGEDENKPFQIKQLGGR